MANSGKKNGIYHIRFRYLGREFNKSLKVRDHATRDVPRTRRSRLSVLPLMPTDFESRSRSDNFLSLLA